MELLRRFFKDFLRGNIYLVLLLRLLVVYFLFTITRLLFYFYNRDLFPGMSLERMLDLLGGGLRFDLTALLYLNLLLIVLTVLPLKIRFNRIYHRALTILFVLMNALGLLANLADMVYYRFTLRRSTSMLFEQFSHETNMAVLIPRFIWDYSGVTFLFILFLIFLIWVAVKFKAVGPRHSNPLIFYGGGVLIACVFLGLSIVGIRGGFRHSTRPIAVSNAMAYAHAPEDVALIVNTPFSLIRTVGTAVTRRVEYFKNDQELRGVYSPEVNPKPEGEFSRENVVVIILESFSAEFVGGLNQWVSNGSYQGYTPFLDSLIRQSVTWQHTFANGRKSIDAMPSVFCSIPSGEVPFVLSHYSHNKVNSLASLLDRKGYHSAFFHGAPNGSMGFDAFAKQAGFKEYFGMTEYGNDSDMDGWWGIWDEPFLQFTAKKISQFKEPFVAGVFTVSSHHPFEVPESFKGKFKPGKSKMHEAVQYTDYALKKFFETAAQQPWFNNTWFIITADHVSSEITLPEYKTIWGRFAVPLIFFKKGIEPRHEGRRVAQQIDVLPTVLSLLQYEEPYLAFGNDLTSKHSEFAFGYVHPVHHLYSDSLIYRFDGSRITEVYEYASDRFLKNNLAGSINLSIPERAIKARIQQYNNRMVENRLMFP